MPFISSITLSQPKKEKELEVVQPQALDFYGGADGTHAHGLRRDRTMNAALLHRISASYVASRSLAWVFVGSKTHKKTTVSFSKAQLHGAIFSRFFLCGFIELIKNATWHPSFVLIWCVKISHDKISDVNMHIAAWWLFHFITFTKFVISMKIVTI